MTADTICSLLATVYFSFILYNSFDNNGTYYSCSECGINSTRPKNMPWKCGDCEDGIKR